MDHAAFRNPTDAAPGVEGCPDPVRLRAFLNERLAADAANWIEEHLEQCPACFELAFGAGVVDLLRAAGDASGIYPRATSERGVDESRASTPMAGSPRNASTAVTRASGGEFPVPSAAEHTLNPDTTQATRWGDYELLSQIGQGGMGIVYRARQRTLGRIVALKVIRSAEFASGEALLRFRREAEAAAHLRHPHIVTVHEVGQYQGQSYYSMDYIDGFTLAEAVNRASLEVREAAELMRQVALAVDYAHGQGILHRDLKPSNILLDRESRPHVSDFGLAKRLSGDESLTETGQVLGTPGYMSPEQITARESPTAASDVYSLGATLYCLLTGRPPFRAATAVETLRLALDSEPVPLRRLNPQVPQDLEAICFRCLEKRPVRRYGRAAELAEELGRFLEGKPVQARPVTVPVRLWRWCRQRPGAASLVAMLLLSVVTGVASVGWQWRVAQQRRFQAEENLEQANVQKEAAQRERSSALAARQREAQARRAAEEALADAQRLLYAHQIVVIDKEWRRNNAASARRMLWETEPRLRHWEWRYLRQVIEGDTVVLGGREAALYGAAWLNRDQVATLTRDGEIRIWDTTGQTLRVDSHIVEGVRTRWPGLEVRGNRLAALIPSPARRHLRGELPAIFQGATAVPQVWDTGNWHSLIKLTNERSAESLTLSHDGGHLAVGGYGMGVRIYRTADGQQVQTLREDERERPAEFSDDGVQLVTVSATGTRVWDWKAARKRHQFVGHGVHATFHPRQPAIAVAQGQDVTLWSLENGQQLARLTNQESNVGVVRFSHDGRRLASAGFDTTVRIWDRDTRRQVAVLRGHEDAIHSLEFGMDEQRLLTGSLDGTARIWNLEKTSLADRAKLNFTRISRIALHPDGRHAVTARRNEIYLWKLEDASVVRSWKADGPAVGTDYLNAEGRARNGGPWTPEIMARSGVTAEEQTTRRIVLNGDGTLLASLGAESLRVWDIANGKEVSTLPIQEDCVVVGFAFSTREQLAILHTNRLPPGRHTEKPTDPGQRSLRGEGLAVWNLSTRASVGQMDLSSRPATRSRDYLATEPSLAPSPDGKMVAAALRRPSTPLDEGRIVAGSDVILWDMETGRELRRLVGHADTVSAIAWRGDSGQLATASRDGTVRLWDPATGTQLSALRGHARHGLVSVAYSPDGERLMSSDGTLWHVNTGLELLSLAAPEDVPSRVYRGIRFSADGHRVVAIDDQSVISWHGDPVD